MPYPVDYERDYGFQTFQDSHPEDPPPGDKLDTEFDGVSAAVTALVAFVKKFTRADGKLANGIVGLDALGADFSIGFKSPTTWEAGVTYKALDTAFYSTGFYQANVDHTSGSTFDPSKWTILVDFGAAIAAAVTVSGSLVAANNLSDVPTKATARTNLGLGSIATHPTTDFDSAGAAASAQAAAIAASCQRSNNLSDVANAGTARGNIGCKNGATTTITVQNGGSPPGGASDGDLCFIW